MMQESIGVLPKVGEKRKNLFGKLQIFTLQDLLEHYPKDYEDRREILTIAQVLVQGSGTFVGQVVQCDNVRIKNKLLTRVKVKDQTAAVLLFFYNQGYLQKQFQVGERFLFSGTAAKKYGQFQMTSPAYEKIGPDGQVHGEIVPQYPLTAGLSQKVLRSFIKEALKRTAHPIEDILPLWLRQQYNLCDKNFALHQIHFPSDFESFEIARNRLVFEELFVLQFSLFKIKNGVSQKKGYQVQKPDLSPVLGQLPYHLTEDQNKVLDEIFADMQKGIAMNRLVQGDVGSGKTAVAMLSCFGAIENGLQCALMAPTEVLAYQHYESFGIFKSLGIQVVFLSGSLGKKEREAAYSKIATGEAQMVIGTHAVIQKGVVFHKLGLVITDEQHRFGVRQRNDFTKKGQNPHVLVMTATPIPRTLALILYGDLDISIIRQMPPGRKKVDTFSVTTAYRERIYRFLQKQVTEGRQCYVICPAVEESETLDVENVLQYTEKLQKKLTGCQVACLHGKMKNADKMEIMAAFYQNKIHVLVSTTVVEVGVNNPNASVMAVENAERFGLAQLHQLRGRVGRGAYQSYCILLSDADTAVARERLKAMVDTEDGFEISEKDLALRGPGDFFGIKQHGLPELKISNLYKDMEILKQAQQAAQQLFQKDCLLTAEEHQALKKSLIRPDMEIRL